MNKNKAFTLAEVLITLTVIGIIAAMVIPSLMADINEKAFETANGESVLVYYNPNCQPDLKETAIHFVQPKMCANFVYDLNGEKAPNAVGKDIGFITVMYSSNPVVVAPMPQTTVAATNKKQTEALAACKAQDSESRLPNKDELTSMSYNNKLTGITSGVFWTNSVITQGATGLVWDASIGSVVRSPENKSYPHDVFCIKK